MYHFSSELDSRKSVSIRKFCDMLRHYLRICITKSAFIVVFRFWNFLEKDLINRIMTWSNYCRVTVILCIVYSSISGSPLIRFNSQYSEVVKSIQLVSCSLLWLLIIVKLYPDKAANQRRDRYSLSRGGSVCGAIKLSNPMILFIIQSSIFTMNSSCPSTSNCDLSNHCLTLMSRDDDGI